jgi:hypothetical protein
MQLVLELPETAFSALRLSPKDYLDELRRAGAKYIFLKTGAYRPADLARAVACRAAAEA